VTFRKKHKTVIPAQAGIHLSAVRAAEKWIPAFAGMTNEKWTLPLLRGGRGDRRRVGEGGHYLAGEALDIRA
jgi:hypothetical protein